MGSQGLQSIGDGSMVGKLVEFRRPVLVNPKHLFLYKNQATIKSNNSDVSWRTRWFNTKKQMEWNEMNWSCTIQRTFPVKAAVVVLCHCEI